MRKSSMYSSSALRNCIITLIFNLIYAREKRQTTYFVQAQSCSLESPNSGQLRLIEIKSLVAKYFLFWLPDYFF